MSDGMKKTNAKGEPLTCKFCHAEVWFDPIQYRYFDVGGTILHVENCEKRREHYSNEAANVRDAMRQAQIAKDYRIRKAQRKREGA